MFLEQPVATRPAVRVLYVDDSEFDRDLVRDALEQEHGGFALTETASRQQFESALERDDYDLVLTDFNILGFTGLQVIRLVQSSKPQLPVIVVTGTGSEEVAVEAIKLGAWDYVIKSPAHIRRLPSTIHNVLARHEALLAKARADEELRDSQTRLELALAAGHMGVFDWDMSTGHILWEANHAKLFGLAPGEFDGTYARFARCVHPEDLPEIDRAMQVALDSRSEFDAEYRVVWPDGSVHWIAGRGRFWYGDDGRAVRMSGVVIDVDRRRTLEETARRQQADLAHLLRLSLLSQLASGLAHEINQPLTAIANFAGAAIQLHRDGKLTPDQARDVLGEIHQQSHRAGQIVQRLRGFMRKRSTGVTPCDVRALVAEALALMKPELSRHGVRARLSAGADVPRVPADAVQIQQVLVNLIQNAIDSIREGGGGGGNGNGNGARAITVTTTSSGDQVVVRVSDTGKGVGAQDLPRIFDSFFSTKSHGLGMGLNISRSIIESHGGRLVARNNPEGGATFEFLLPTGGQRLS